MRHARLRLKKLVYLYVMNYAKAWDVGRHWAAWEMFVLPAALVFTGKEGAFLKRITWKSFFSGLFELMLKNKRGM